MGLSIWGAGAGSVASDDTDHEGSRRRCRPQRRQGHHGNGKVTLHGIDSEAVVREATARAVGGVTRSGLLQVVKELPESVKAADKDVKEAVANAQRTTPRGNQSVDNGLGSSMEDSRPWPLSFWPSTAYGIPVGGGLQSDQGEVFFIPWAGPSGPKAIDGVTNVPGASPNPRRSFKWLRKDRRAPADPSGPICSPILDRPTAASSVFESAGVKERS
jgi:hypothetical protein